MPSPTLRVAALLFGSGFCALIYQLAWTRELRLVFGASTAASAAVLAIFIGGLGAGGLVLGRRTDRHRAPLRLYGQLEACVAIAAAFTPLWLWLARAGYVALGGKSALGEVGSTVARLLLAAVVLGVPTFLMGGTLPAAIGAVQSDDDVGRRRVALLYGVNTLGAVAGCVAATFVLLEHLGTRSTLWTAALLNGLVALVALSTARDLPEPATPTIATPNTMLARAAPRAFVLAAALSSGVAFFLMELVWYRLLGPLLGGTVFTFGLILASALLGIGLGGLANALLGKGRPISLFGFAATCLLEALAMAVPFALGDSLAVLALALKPLGVFGFAGHVAGWAMVCAIVVVPAAFAAGVQFPLLISLLGRGRAEVGRDVGLVYAWNTAGAIGGALAGGFGLLPWLGAPGCWRLVAATLLALGLAALGLGHAQGGARRARVVAAGLAVAALTIACLAATGPTAAWRHSPIGAGRVRPLAIQSPNEQRAWLEAQRAHVIWEAEGVESSVALTNDSGLAFVVNGKVDGNARGDAATQVMAGLVGAILHPKPERALVIGLGTGSSAGWLGAVPSMKAVEVVELEPAILEVATRCAAVNHDAMSNPKVKISLGDAREVLLTTRQRYDLIFSEPSNPYRAGVASLFTRELYQSAADRLAPGGMFLQWVQGYEVEAETVRTIIATLAAVFPEIELWQLADRDLLLVASQEPVVFELATLARRIAEPPYREALAGAWATDSLEGFLGHYLARGTLARAIAEAEGDAQNTDDRNVVEFGFARGLQGVHPFHPALVRKVARARDEDRPAVAGDVDWSRVEDERLATRLGLSMAFEAPPTLPPTFTVDQKKRAQALIAYGSGNPSGALEHWRAQPEEPRGLVERWVVADLLAETGDDAALAHMERLAPGIEAELVRARWLARKRRPADAAAALRRAFERARVDPWWWPLLMQRAFRLSEELAKAAPSEAPGLVAALRQPFAVHASETARQSTLLALAAGLADLSTCAELVRTYDPHPPWTAAFLKTRLACLDAVDDPEAERAARDLSRFLEHEPSTFEEGL